MLDVTVKEVLPDGEVTLWMAGVTESAGAAWVTVTTMGVNPETVTVLLATRDDEVLLTE